MSRRVIIPGAFRDSLHSLACCALTIAFGASIECHAASSTPQAPYVPTPSAAADRMLELASVGPGDYVIDLGSGDGRLVIAAVRRYGARGGLGIELDPELVRRSAETARSSGVADRVRFVQQDLFEANVGEASVVTIYLLPWMMRRLEGKLARELRPGTRVVVHDFPFPNWTPERVEEFESLDKLRVTGFAEARLFLYRVPQR